MRRNRSFGYRLPRSAAVWLLAGLAVAGCGQDGTGGGAAPAAVPVGVVTVRAADVPFVAEFVGETESS